ncbi:MULTISPECIES: hypothetical protein [Lysinibacillus]|uniref:Uncharacterized protein n=1 Tax=Lysinibacillus irui TaxID=2998077 RepID=A0AAJ5UST9_9BACI|nr:MULTISPECIES: hypothetical protein [Lysinibacillus]WDV06268.1 hypothetical protein OU989_18710 [Lysinibacillus irui]
MKKLIIPILLFSLLLFACEAQQTEEHFVPEPANSSNEEDLNFSTDEWQQLAFDSSWYRNLNINSEDTYSKMVDFEGDQVPEIFIGYNGTHYGYIIGKYNKENKTWSLWTSLQEETPIHGEVRFKGYLKEQDNKEIPLITVFNANASNYSEVLHLLKVSNDNNKIISGQTYNLSMNRELVIDSANSFSIQAESYSEHYKLLDHTIINEYGTTKLFSGLPIIQNDSLLTLLNHNFFQTGIIFGDSYPTAKIKAGTPNYEDFYEGGLCSFYEDYFFCLGEDEIPISHFYLSNFRNNVTKADLEQAVGQGIQISSFERFENPDDIVYYADFEFDNVYFHAEFNHNQSDATLVNLTLSLTLHNS